MFAKFSIYGRNIPINTTAVPHSLWKKLFCLASWNDSLATVIWLMSFWPRPPSLGSSSSSYPSTRLQSNCISLPCDWSQKSVSHNSEWFWRHLCCTLAWSFSSGTRTCCQRDAQLVMNSVIEQWGWFLLRRKHKHIGTSTQHTAHSTLHTAHCTSIIITVLRRSTTQTHAEHTFFYLLLLVHVLIVVSSDDALLKA